VAGNQPALANNAHDIVLPYVGVARRSVWNGASVCDGFGGRWLVQTQDAQTISSLKKMLRAGENARKKRFWACVAGGMAWRVLLPCCLALLRHLPALLHASRLAAYVSCCVTAPSRRWRVSVLAACALQALLVGNENDRSRRLAAPTHQHVGGWFSLLWRQWAQRHGTTSSRRRQCAARSGYRVAFRRYFL